MMCRSKWRPKFLVLYFHWSSWHSPGANILPRSIISLGERGIEKFKRNKLTGNSVRFRADLQGLRGIAVLLVLAGHAKVPFFSGGFIGVDIFLVLSGFFISAILLNSRKDKQASFSAFLYQRLKRLYPALLACIFVSYILIHTLLPSSIASQVTNSTVYAILWVSNLFFANSEIGYFETLANKDLFIHTWSLGIEMQFYIVWGGIFFFLCRKGLNKNLLYGFTLVTIFLSFVFSQYLLWLDSKYAFYGLPSRLWQFSLGATIYLYFFFSSKTQVSYKQNSRIISLARVLGILILAICCAYYHEQMGYPGLYALAPTFAAALIILVGIWNEGKSTLLGNKILVPIGDRAYSLYLWHWPIFAIMEMTGIWDNLLAQVLSTASLIIISEVSFRYIETPFWKGRFHQVEKRKFFQAIGVYFIFFITLGFYFTQKEANNSLQVKDFGRGDFPALYKYQCDHWYANSKPIACVFGNQDGNKTAVLVADSVGAQWFSAIFSRFPPPEWRFIVFTKSSCPIVDKDFVYERIGKIYDVCREWKSAVIKKLEEIKPEVIVIGSDSYYPFSREDWIDGSKRIFEPLSKISKQVFVITGTPRLHFDGPSCLAAAFNSGKVLDENICRSEKKLAKAKQVYNYLVEASSNMPMVEVLNFNDLICDDSSCASLSKQRIPVYRDETHISDTFVRFHAKQVEERFKIN